MTTETVVDKVQEAVDRGAAWLDKKYPGWARTIDFETLALWDAERCILGQVGAANGNENLWSETYDEYDTEIGQHLGGKFISEHGFVHIGGYGGEGGTKNAWRVAVNERLSV